MELRVFLSLLFTALAFLAAGFFAYHSPSYLGGSFKFVRTQKFLSIRHSISSNDFVIRNTKIIGTGIFTAGVLALVFAVTYLFYPEIRFVFNYAK